MSLLPDPRQLAERPAVTVDTLLFSIGEEKPENYRKLPEKVLKVLLVRRHEPPFAGQWSLPGGFVKLTEDLDTAAYRILVGETQVKDVYLEQLYSWGDPQRDSRMRVISCSYLALADHSTLAMEPTEDVRWFTVRRKVVEQKKALSEEDCSFQETILLQLTADEIVLTGKLETVKRASDKVNQKERHILESEELALDHAKIIDYGIERLQNKLEYTDIVFHLMPEYFTLTELQKVYETILGQELLKANFRRKIAGFVMETNQMTKDEGHRPAKLYRHNAHWHSDMLMNY